MTQKHFIGMDGTHGVSGMAAHTYGQGRPVVC